MERACQWGERALAYTDAAAVVLGFDTGASEMHVPESLPSDLLMSSVDLQFNSAAKQLIEWDQPPGPGVGAGEGTPAAPSSTAPKQPDAKKNTKKRHSFTSLTMASKASQAAQHRHSMEISPPVLISSSNPTAAARIGELAGLSCSAPSQVPPTSPSAARTLGSNGSL